MSEAISNQTMKAVLWEGNAFSVTTQDVPIPKILAPEDAIVRITSSTICGSDLHIYHGLFGSPEVPYQVGHEAVGIVQEVGKAVDALKVGDRVVILDFAQDGRVVTEPTLISKTGSGAVGFGLGMTLGGTDQGLQCNVLQLVSTIGNTC
jgi:threonine dehydrogenase-like Zn-dependent dehydrogenase